MTVKNLQLKPEVASLAEILKKGISVDNQTGTGTAEDSLYDSNLPESLTPEIVKSVSDYNTTFAAAGTFAIGELAVEAMSSNKNLDRVSASIAMGGKDSLNVNVDRSREFTNHLGGGGLTEKFGVTNVSYEVVAGKNAGQLKKARMMIGELALEQLKK